MKRLMSAGAVACGLLALVSSAGSAQGVVITGDSIDAARALSEANNTVDRLIDGVELPGGRFALAALRRVRAETNGLIHSDVTEVYYITEGAGTLVTGGTLADPRDTDLSRVWAGASVSGTHQGGEGRRVGPGDVIVVPAGTVHRFSELDGVIRYLVFRFESVE